jgi:hypothetical protein
VEISHFTRILEIGFKTITSRYYVQVSTF